jgi:single-stranded-DNA-specific exonuclease
VLRPAPPARDESQVIDPWHPEAVLEPRYRWVFPELIDIDTDFARAAASRGVADRMTALLARRGVSGVDDLNAWFDDPHAGLHDPRLLPDADRLLDRLRTARDRGERVMVFGDFDADGLDGLAILTLAFRRFGLDVEPYVPSRLDEGHGLSIAAIDAAAGSGCSLIVTVDCGTSSAVEISIASQRGIDVIVTDHHRVPPVPPPALALVNPHRPDSVYPDRRLSGAGIAFAVARLLMRDLVDDEPAAFELADFAAIGTIADVAPVLGENRAIVRLGLERLRVDTRPAFAAFVSGARGGAAKFDAESIAFSLAPRLNAAGRVGEAELAVDLLLSDDQI